MTSDTRVGRGSKIAGPQIGHYRVGQGRSKLKNSQKMWDVINGCSRSLILISSYVQKVQKYNCLSFELEKTLADQQLKTVSDQEYLGMCN